MAAAQNRNKVLPTAESIRSVGALIVVVTGVIADHRARYRSQAFVDSGKAANAEIPLATAAFGVISVVVRGAEGHDCK